MKMKKLILMMAIAAAGAGGCEKRPEPLKIDNALTAEEIAAGRLTPEVMWKMSRAGGSSLSPDGKRLLYQQTDYNMAENRGVTTIRVEEMDSKAVTCLTDFTSNNLSPQWSADGQHIYFLSDRGGSMQVWRMNASGGDATQITGDGDYEGVPDVEGFGVSPDGKHIWWVQTVRTADRRSSDIYEDMDKSKARIYDDLMARHWDYWDEGEYRHIFVGELGKGLVTGGKDIMPDAQWDAPLAPYFDMAEIAWSNAGDKLAYTCKPLTGTEYAVSTDSDIFVYDLASGETKNICKPLTGKSECQGEASLDLAEMVGYDKYPVWSPDDSKIAFLSQRRPGNESDKARLFLYDCRVGRDAGPDGGFRLQRHERRLGGQRPSLVHRPDRGHAPDLPHRAVGRRSGGRHPRRPRHQRLHDGLGPDRRRDVHDLDGHGVLRREPGGRHADAGVSH